ncbi:MAG: porin family protein [Hahellaceae bacterium]|nr:porin family protein [Hahellaceae bacterium]MCP5210415.1 porin family protein [Hahellaceae bacterium]
MRQVTLAGRNFIDTIVKPTMSLMMLACMVLNSAQAAEDSNGDYIGGFYIGTSTGQLTITADDFKGDFETTTLDVMFGVDIVDKYVGLESRFGWGNSAYSDFTTIDLKRYFSAYAKPQYNIGIFQLYGLLGGTIARIDLATTVCNQLCFKVYGEDNDFGLSYGAGVGVNFDMIGLKLEYLQLLDGGDYQISRPALAFTFSLH